MLVTELLTQTYSIVNRRKLKTRVRGNQMPCLLCDVKTRKYSTVLKKTVDIFAA